MPPMYINASRFLAEVQTKKKEKGPLGLCSDLLQLILTWSYSILSYGILN